MVKRKRKELNDLELAQLSIGIPLGTGVAVVAGQSVATGLGQDISPALNPLLPAAGLFGAVGLTGLAVRQLKRIDPQTKKRMRK